MVIAVSLIVLVLLLGLLSGSTSIIILLPVVVFGGLAAVFITTVIREARPPINRSVRQLPTGHLQRQMYLALRPRRPRPQPGQKAKEPENGSSAPSD